ncbi:unnamed protein product [Rhizoctonia solani]|uniref:JmjC domain-containing protein n=1 Tax=Rhizoctonia solani TaxID=456999 RepID=A0A8H3DZM6_9AGAM|nr:unnamed protein product [Rhizoctonia solani]
MSTTPAKTELTLSPKGSTGFPRTITQQSRETMVENEEEREAARSSVWKPAEGPGSRPPVPQKFAHTIFDPRIAPLRKVYTKIIVMTLVLTIIMMWICLPVYWGSLARSANHAPSLKAWVIDQDGGEIGQAVVQGLLATTQSGTKQHLGWVQVAADYVEDVGAAIVDEQAWGAVVVNAGATARLAAARASGDSSYSPASAITFYYAQARNEQATGSYVNPLTTAALTQHPASDPVGVKFDSPGIDEVSHEEPKYHLPYQWNVTPQIEQVEQMRLAIARALYPILKEELAHASKPNVIRRAIEIEPVTRFSRLELEQTVTDMESIIEENTKNAPAPREDSTSRTAQAQIANWASRVPLWNPTSPHASTEPPALSSAGSSRDVSSSRGTPDPQLPTMPAIASPTMSPTHEDQFSPEVGPLPGKRPIVSHHGRLDPASVPSHPVHHFSKNLPEDQFKPLWARGEAIVVQDLLGQFELNWTPEYFTSEFGEQRCMVVNCSDNKDTEMMVKEFFEMFGKADREAGILKLKANFKDDFPKLYDDFMGALPVPNYTRRDGILNLASHFATNAIAPDLGPKMYNAFTSIEGPGGQGSTRLHMDMADAVNIMMYASESPDGSPGVAAWDIFRASDSDKIRAYLRRNFKDRANEFRDPIHSQLFYLDSNHRKRLYDEEQVFSWRIYQRPGDAVFIPAGCAHQVCNLADCIKIAIDFVSIENIDRCEKLTTEFRNENDTFTWKEDVLQLRTMMMYAWRSTTQLRKCWYDDLAYLEQADAASSSDLYPSADP